MRVCACVRHEGGMRVRFETVMRSGSFLKPEANSVQHQAQVPCMRWRAARDYFKVMVLCCNTSSVWQFGFLHLTYRAIRHHINLQQQAGSRPEYPAHLQFSGTITVEAARSRRASERARLRTSHHCQTRGQTRQSQGRTATAGEGVALRPTLSSKLKKSQRSATTAILRVASAGALPRRR